MEKTSEFVFVVPVQWSNENGLQMEIMLFSRHQKWMEMPDMATREEVETYLNGSASLLFDENKVGNLRKYKLCMQGEVGDN